MLRPSHRLSILLPAFLLAVCIGLFIVSEVQVIDQDEAINKTVNTEVHDLTLALQQDVWNMALSLHKAMNYADDPVFASTTASDFSEAYQKTSRRIVDVEAYFLAHEDDATEYASVVVILRKLIDRFHEFQNILPKSPPYNAMTMKMVIPVLSDMTMACQEFVDGFHDRQKNLVNISFEREENKEEMRIILSAMILLCIGILVLSLVRVAGTFRRNAEVAWAMERYNALFGAALQSIHVGVLIRDMQKLERPVVFTNDAFTKLTGYDFASIKDKKSDVLFGWHTNPTTVDTFHDTVRNEKAATFNILVYRKEGSSFWSEWHVSPVRDKAGRLTHYVSLITDVTTLKQAQEGLLLAKEQAERASAVKTNFLATMSHEIRTPINGLLGVLDLVSDTKLTVEQQRYIDIAMSSGRALHTIINDILDYAKMEAGKVDLVIEPFALRRLLQDTLDISAPIVKRKNVALHLEVQDTVPDLLVSDPGRIRQIVLNLLSNAIKFTDKGSVTLRVLHLLTQDLGGEPVALVRFEVQDTGIGISAVDQDKLFKEFSQVERSFTRRFGGTGLGLAITRRLVDMMNGEIGVTSKPGVGSTFWFMLPLPLAQDKDLETAKITRASANATVLSSETLRDRAVLLVEDNETNRLVAIRYLQKAGFEPDVAVNGLEAVKMAAERYYDMILMDISMAEMDGLQATQAIRASGAHGAKVPIVALTAHVMPGDKERFLAAGMNDYLNKPIEYPLLFRALVRWMNLPVDSDVAESPHEEPPVAQDMTTPPEMVSLTTLEPAPVETLSPPQETVVPVVPAIPVNDSPPAPVPHEVVAPQPFPAETIYKETIKTGKPDLDPDVLRRLGEELGRDVVWRVTGVFLEDSQKRIAPLIEGSADNDITSLRDAAHTLKSSSASCGLLRFSSLMADIEKAAASENRDSVNVLLQKVVSTYEDARAALEKARVPYQT